MPGQSYRRPGGPPPIGLPPMSDLTKKVLGGLLALYVAELVLTVVGLDPFTWLAWRPLGGAWQPWQPVTRFLVMGAGSPLSVVIGLFVLYLVFPWVEGALGPRQRREALLYTAGGATLLPLLFDVGGWMGLGVGRATLHGWSTVLITGAITLFGLANPRQTVMLFFVLPIQAAWFVWGTLIVAFLLLLSALATGGPVNQPAETLGTWLGVWGWWNLRGPGARRGQLKRKAKDIERELRNFQVLPGGRGDDTVH